VATIYTVGHSTRPIDELLALLAGRSIGLLVDVRTVPRSRRNPQFEGGALSERLSADGVAYWHERALGGFRRPRPRSPNRGWPHAAFQGYADHMTSPEFGEALDRLQAMAREQPTCIMCAEAQWWRCHRRLISDALTIRDWQVLHLGMGGKAQAHELTSFAVVWRDGRLTYPPAQAELDLG